MPALLLSGCRAPEPLVADTLYVGGVIYTMDDERSLAEALAVRDGELLAVGTATEVKELRGEDTEVIDLEGRFVLPGLHDAHLHLQMVAEFEAHLNLDPAAPWDQIEAEIRGYAEDNPEKQWILGGNLDWLTETIGDGPTAHRSTLDALVPNQAIALWDVGGHALLANTLALEWVGIDAETPDPVGGTIERDDRGEPTGVLRELAANLVLERADQLSAEQYAAGIRSAIERLSALGITSLHEAWAYPATLAALRDLDQAGELDARVTVAIAHPVEFVTEPAQKLARETIERRLDFEGPRLKAPYVKFVLDGSAGGQTLVLTEPYVGSDFKGDMRNPTDVVLEEVSRLHAEGIGTLLHGVGDGAIRVALDAVEGALDEHGDTGARHIVAHSVFVNPEDLGRFAELGVVAELSPTFWYPNDGAEILRAELGEERLGWAFPARSLLDRGTTLAAGSDWPVVYDPNPFPAIETLVTRERPGGSSESFGKEHALTLDEAIAAFTRGGAFALRQEAVTGSLEPGKAADFIVVDRNLLEVPLRTVHQTVVLRTVVGGETVYQAPSEDSP